MRAPAVSLLLLLAGCRQTEADPELVRQRELWAAQQRKLAGIERAVRQALPGGAPCAELPGTGPALLVDADYLAHLGGRAADPYAGEGARYRLLTASKLRNLQAGSLLDRVFKLKRLEDEHRFYAVVVVREKTLPAIRGEQFGAGRLAGDLVMVESSDGRVLCNTPFVATSSDQVAAVAGGRAEAVEKDFELRIRRELGDSAARLNRGFVLELR